MSKPRRIYTREYKAEAVKLLSQQGISAGEAGRRLGIGSNLIVRWKKEIESEGVHAFPEMATVLLLRRSYTGCGARTSDC